MLDAIIVGAGFGGLSAALRLAEGGAKVALVEALNYPGGCASTFTRQGFRFEAGATLFSGFGPGQLFAQLIERHKLSVETRALDPILELRTPSLRLAVPADRQGLIDRFCALPGAPAPAIRSFFDQQRKVADALWTLLDDPALLPPLGAAALLRHVGRAPRYLPLLSILGRPLSKVLRRHGLQDCEPLRTYCDAVCQITVQSDANRAEAPLALSALDYLFRGTRHVEGGIGALAWSLVEGLRKLGGEVKFTERAISARREDGCFSVTTRRRELKAKHLILNLLPRAAGALLGLRLRGGEGAVESGDDAKGREDDTGRGAGLVASAVSPASARLEALNARVEQGWGAAMLYLALPNDAPLPESAGHLELVADPSRPFHSGNHVFCSYSGASERERGPGAARTVTVSTHVDLPALLAKPPPERASAIAQIQATMEATIQALAPELCQRRLLTLTASPRTFERFTRRPSGFVGGIPRHAGFDSYRDLFGGQPIPGVQLVGDSVFPGQSTLAVAIGGIKAAEKVLKG